MRKLAPLLIALATFVLSDLAVASGNVRALADRLAHDDDFRTRVRAALLLGKVKEEKPLAREALEQGLRDGNASVRSASIAALQVLGDKRAVPAIERLTSDASPAVRRQAESALVELTKTTSSSPAPSAPRAPAHASGSGVLVEAGKFRDATGKLTSGLAQLRVATIESLGELEGIEYVEDEQTGERIAKQTGRPRVRLGGWLKDLKESREGAYAVFVASVEYVVYRLPGRAIAGKVRGSARVRCSADELRDPKKKERLQRSAIEAAVSSAMRRAPQAIAFARPGG
jgi:hypothetical protein